MQRRIKVGVIRGGTSSEYEASLNTGAAILHALRERLENSYEPVDVLIDKKGNWFIAGKQIKPEDSGRFFDIAWIGLHGSGADGSDSKIQSIFEAHRIPFTGSGSLSSAVSMNKALAKEILKAAGIKSPYWKEVQSADVSHDPKKATEELFNSFTFPAVIKPARGGSSIGVSIVRNKKDIADALIEAARHGDVILVEEYIQGDEVSCAVIEGFRGQDLYALPVIDILDGKHTVPSRLALQDKKRIEETARAMHSILGLRHYSLSDFIIHPRRGIYALEANPQPRLSENARLSDALRAVGSDLHELIDHVIRRELGV